MFQLFQEKSSGVKSVVMEGMTLDQVKAAMLALMAEESINHHRMGQLYNYVMQHKLAEVAGFKDAADYFRQNIRDMSPATLSAYGLVARFFSEEVGRRFGVTCLYLLMTYKELAGLEVNHEEPGPTLIEVPGKNGEVAPKKFSDCTVDEMRKAIQRKRKPTSSKPLPEDERALASKVVELVSQYFEKGDPVLVELRNHQGMAVLDFKGIPLAKLKKLLQALKAHLADGEEVEEQAPPTS